MSRLKELRERAGLTQAELARRAGVSRQLIGAAETGRNLPRVDTGVALAAALGTDVADLFALEDVPIDIVTGDPAPEGALVRVGRVGRRTVTAPLHTGNEGWGTADGLIEAGSLTRFVDRRDGLVVAGCEPGLAILEQGLRHMGSAAVAVGASSAAAIEALGDGRVHAAVVHGPALERIAEVGEVVRVRLASWEVGLGDSPDAAAGWFEEALSGKRPVVQREAGAGVQQTFEARLEPGVVVPGPRANSHIEAAVRAVYGAIPAVTIEPAARLAGASFRSLGVHETELWIASDWAEDRVVTEALDYMASRSFLAPLQHVGGYDLTRFGTTVA
jgi:DNA-binding XRE family transcriptional regulator/molybdate-binding protein